MTELKTLIVGAAMGMLLAVVGVAIARTALNPTAAEVATEMAGRAAADPIVPPAFYGTR
jgi:hypothetical protein